MSARRLIPLRRPGVLREATRAHHPNPLMPTTRGWKAALKEAEIPTTRHDAALKRNLELGLPGAKCLDDRTIPTFSRGELPHFAGINTFMKAPYGPRLACGFAAARHARPRARDRAARSRRATRRARAAEDIREVAKYDATVVGVPFDGGATYRAGTRFGPQGIRRISSLYTPYNFGEPCAAARPAVRAAVPRFRAPRACRGRAFLQAPARPGASRRQTARRARGTQARLLALGRTPRAAAPRPPAPAPGGTQSWASTCASR